MPIGVQQFQPESMESASPFYFAIQNLGQGILQGQQMQSNYQSNKYKGPMLQAQLEEKQLLNKYIPQDKAVELQRALTNQGKLQQSMNRFGPAMALRQSLNSMSPAARSAWIAQNQDAYNELLKQESQAALASQQPAPNVLGSYINQGNNGAQEWPPKEYMDKITNKNPQAQDQTQPQEQPQQPPVIPLQLQSPQDQQPVATAQPQQSSNLLDALTNMQRQADTGAPAGGLQESLTQAAAGPVYDPVAVQNNIIRRASEDSANFSGLTNYEKSRYGAAKTMDEFFRQPDVMEGLYQMTKYPGAAGTSKKLYDYAINPAEYNKYMVATEKLPSLFSGSLAKLEGYPTSELGLTTAKDFLKLNKLSPTSRKKDAQNVVLSQIGLVDQENDSIKKEYERYFSHPDESVSNKKIEAEYMNLRDQGIPEEEAYNRAIASVTDPVTGKPSAKKQNGSSSASTQSGWFTDSNGKHMYRASDGNVYSEEELK